MIATSIMLAVIGVGVVLTVLAIAAVVAIDRAENSQ